MYFLYMDDSFFGSSDFSRDMRYKLQVTLKEMPIDHVLVSNAKTKQSVIEHFFEEFGDIDVKISTTRWNQDGREWVLSNQMLSQEDLQIRPYAGTYCIVDSDTLIYERIYLDLFPQEETDMVSILTEAIQKAMGSLEESKDLKS